MKGIEEFEDVEEISQEGGVPAGNARVPPLDSVLDQLILWFLKGLVCPKMLSSSKKLNLPLIPLFSALHPRRAKLKVMMSSSVLCWVLL